MRETDLQELAAWQEEDDGGTFLDIRDLEGTIDRLEDRQASRSGLQATRQYWADLMAAHKRLGMVLDHAKPHVVKEAVN